MRRRIEQHGVFHVVTKTRQDLPWLTYAGIPEIVIDNICMTTNIQQAQLYGFCVIPNHVHLLLKPGSKGLSEYMRLFKLNTSKDAHIFLRAAGSRTCSVDLVWQSRFYDERIQSFAQYQNAKRYIENNAFKHDLVTDSVQWSWSSLNLPHCVVPCEEW